MKQEEERQMRERREVLGEFRSPRRFGTEWGGDGGMELRMLSPRERMDGK